MAKEYADQQAKADKNNPKLDEIFSEAMAAFMTFWYAFSEHFEAYTHADDSRLADRKLKASLDKEAVKFGVVKKGAASNDDLLRYRSYVTGSRIASETSKLTYDKLHEELKETAKIGKEMYLLPSPDPVNSIVDDLMEGVHWSDRIWSNMDALRSDLTKMMKEALLSHQNPITQSGKLRKRFDVAKYQSDRIIRTESTRVMGEQSIENARQAGFKKVMLVNNSKACDVCRPLNGKVYTLEAAKGIIPIHPNCRCTWSAVSDDDRVKNAILNMNLQFFNKEFNFKPGQTLPHVPLADEAIIPREKLTGYALNPNHPIGGNKARVFQSALGYNVGNYKGLMDQVYKNLGTQQAVYRGTSQYGYNFEVKMNIKGPNGATKNVVTGWMISKTTGKLQLTTIYVDDK